MLWVVAWGALAAIGVTGLFATIQGARFGRRVAREARQLWAERGAEPARQHPPESLPAPVRRYLEAAGATRRAPVSAVRLRHGGVFLPKLDASAFPIRGEQYFSAGPPGFVWWGRIRVAPGVWIDGRDRSLLGEGNMLITFESTRTIADSRGPEMDLGALQRLLGEMAWFPTAFLDARYVGWEAVDDTSARATLRVGGREAGVTFHFGPDGMPAQVTADRYRDVNGKGVLTPWRGESRDYREVDGLRVPFQLTASWLVDGEWRSYGRFDVEQIEFDRPEPF